jgi:hypothetical protein
MMKYLYVMLLLPGIFSCRKNNDDSSACMGNSGNMAVELNDSSYIPSSTRNALYIEDNAAQVATRLDIRVTVDTGTIIISVINRNWQNPPKNGVLIKSYDNPTVNADGPACDTINSIAYCDGYSVIFLPGGNAAAPYENITEGYPGFVQVSECNVSKRTVSGSFDVKMFRIFATSSDTIYLSGTFSDLCYSVLE